LKVKRDADAILEEWKYTSLAPLLRTAYAPA
jgi:hypothetical protein